MNLAQQLRHIRDRIARREPASMAVAFGASSEVVPAIEDLLTEVFLPARRRADLAFERWIMDQTDARAREVCAAYRAPGALTSLYEYLEAPTTQPWTLMRGLDLAILKASKGGVRG